MWTQGDCSVYGQFVRANNDCEAKLSVLTEHHLTYVATTMILQLNILTRAVGLKINKGLI